MSDFHLAVTLSLVAAAIFAFGAQCTRLGLRTLNAQSGALVSIGAATVLYWMAAPWLLESHYWSSDAVWLFIVVGLFRPMLSSTFAMAGTAMLGPTISTTLSSTAPFFGLAFGVLILGETLTTQVGVGTAAIVAGVVVLARGGRAAGEAAWPVWALVLPVLAAVIRVSAALVTKIGMEEVPSAYFAGLMAYNASFAMALVNMARRGVTPHSLFTTRDSLWFVVTGVLFGLAILVLNTALRFGPLSVVGPLVSLEAVFVALLGALVFGERQLTWRVGIAVGLVVAGAVLISAR